MAKNQNRIVILNILATIILQGLSFITNPIFSRVLGTANFGVYSVFNTWSSLFGTVFTLQATGAIVIAKNKYPESEQAQYHSSVLSLAVLSHTCFSILTILIMFPLAQRFNINRILLCLALLDGLGVYILSFLNAKFTYEYRAERNFVISILTSACSIGLSLFLVTLFAKPDNYYGRIIGQTVVNATGGLLASIYVFHQGKTFYNKEYWSFTLPLCIPIVFQWLATLVLGHCDRIMLERMTDYSSVGIYTLANGFAGVIQIIHTALNNSWSPFYFDYLRNNRIEEMKKHAKNYIEIYTILACGFMLLTKEVFQFYAAEDFWPGINYIPLFSIGIYFIFMYTFAINFELFYKRTRLIAAGTVLAAVCNIILNYFLIRIYGPIGAVAATVIAYGLQFLFHFYVVKNSMEEEYPFKLMDFLPGLLIVAGVALFVISGAGNWQVRWGAGAVLGIYLLVRIYRRKAIF